MSEDHIYEKISKNTLAVFLTHAQGFNGYQKTFKSFEKKKLFL